MPILQVLRWSAQDFLHKKYGIEIEALHYFVDSNETNKDDVERLLSPNPEASPTQAIMTCISTALQTINENHDDTLDSHHSPDFPKVRDV